MEIVQEELRAKNGPNGAKSGVVLDKDTNEPIATYTKGYGSYSLDWHPTFKALNPGIAKSYEALDLNNAKPDSLSSVVAQVGDHHDALAGQGFEDRHNISRVTDKEDSNKFNLVYRDKEGNHLATRHINRAEYGPKAHSVTLSKDFTEKHGVSPEIAKAVESRLARNTLHQQFAGALDNEISELKKKKTAVGTHAFGDAHVGVYHIETSPEEASIAHEDQLKSRYSINRLSPTHFVGTSHDGEDMIHSTAFGNQLHQIKTRVAGYYAKKLSFNHSF